MDLNPEPLDQEVIILANYSICSKFGVETYFFWDNQIFEPMIWNFMDFTFDILGVFK